MSGTTTGLTAQRFEGKPLTQPAYSFRNVPKCSRDLAGSSIAYADRREPFVDSMAEMILLTKECMRRQAEMRDAKEKEAEEAAAAASKKGGRKRGSSSKKARSEGEAVDGEKKRTSKPLSLEYMADRTGKLHFTACIYVLLVQLQLGLQLGLYGKACVSVLACGICMILCSAYLHLTSFALTMPCCLSSKFDDVANDNYLQTLTIPYLDTL